MTGIPVSYYLCATPHAYGAEAVLCLREVAGQDFVMPERTYSPGFHDLIFDILRDARIVPNVSQTAAEIPTLISLVDSSMGITILPASAVTHSVASVVACEILDRMPMCEIGQ